MKRVLLIAALLTLLATTTVQARGSVQLSVIPVNGYYASIPALVKLQQHGQVQAAFASRGLESVTQRTIYHATFWVDSGIVRVAIFKEGWYCPIRVYRMPDADAAMYLVCHQLIQKPMDRGEVRWRATR